jgi:DNA-binding NarL/FixJ family response regulator
MRVALIEDHVMVAAALEAALAAGGIDVGPGVSDVAQLDRWFAEVGPLDAVLLDLRLGDGVDGLELVPTLRRRLPGTKIVVLSAWSDEASLQRALDAGCDGYLLKEQTIDELRAGLRAVVAGEPAFAPRLTQQYLGLVHERDRQLHGLTATELSVLELIAEGLSSREIGERLHISANTVRNHAQSILGKLGVHTRSAAVAAAVRHRILAP